MYYNTNTHNHLTAFVRDNQGRPVPEETLTHSHPTWSSDILYHLPPFTTIHSILSVHFPCLTILSDNLSPGPLWSWTLNFILHTLLTKMGVSGWMFLLVPAYPGCPGQTAVKWLLLLLLLLYTAPVSRHLSQQLQDFVGEKFYHLCAVWSCGYELMHSGYREGTRVLRVLHHLHTSADLPIII